MYALRHPDRLFHDIDTDNSGKLNMKELEQMVAGFLAYQREIELKAEAERQAHLDAKARRKNELAQREVDSALSQAAATSYELMDICDRNSRNGLLTVLEIVSFCTAPKYKDFIEWLKADNYKALKSHDVDHSGDISRVELEQIVSNYFDEVGGARCRARFRRAPPCLARAHSLTHTRTPPPPPDTKSSRSRVRAARSATSRRCRRCSSRPTSDRSRATRAGRWRSRARSSRRRTRRSRAARLTRRYRRTTSSRTSSTARRAPRPTPGRRARRSGSSTSPSRARRRAAADGGPARPGTSRGPGARPAAPAAAAGCGSRSSRSRAPSPIA